MTREPSAAIEIGGKSIGVDGSLTESPPASQSFVNVQDPCLNGSLRQFNQGGGMEENLSTSCGTRPFELLPGEREEEQADFIGFRLFLTNYRLCIVSTSDQSIGVVPLIGLDGIDFKDPSQICIACKDGKVYRFTAATHELAIHWHRRLIKCSNRSNVDEAFAWQFAEAVTIGNNQSQRGWLSESLQDERDICLQEWNRLDFDENFFKVFSGNENHKFIETYPENFIVPKHLSDTELEQVKNFRFLNRMPVAVWRCKETGAILLRSSQPRSGLFLWRNDSDEKLLKCVDEYMKHTDKSKGVESVEGESRIRIFDARSYAAAWANRAKGGGFENPEYYWNTKTTFLGLPNIHAIRYSFTQLRNVLSAPCGIDQTTYLQSVQTTNWLHYLSNLLFESNNCVDILTVEGSSVLVHCSDGWDRTTQIVAFAKLIADEHYRTLEGFEHLIRREWLEFGHKFADRCGVSGNDTNERSPVFLQWLDGVWHLMKFNPTAFQFNHQYLLKLAQHVYSGLFGSFLFNNMAEAAKANHRKHPSISIWRFLGKHTETLINEVYEPLKGRLTVKFGVQYMEVWKECYCAETLAETIANVECLPSSSRAELSSPSSRDSTASIHRSKSSESISSVTETTPSNGTTILNSFHSESNGALTSLNEHHPTSEMTDSMLLTQRHEARVRSMTNRSVNAKEMLDSDGLVIFFDPEQEIMRKKRKERDEELRRANEKISKISRERSISERTNGSNSSKDSVGRLASVGEPECEYDSSNTDRFSDVVVVEHTHASAPSSKGWDLNNSKCCECEKTFNQFSLSAKERPHHCRACGRIVCEDCSPNKYHSIHDGQSVYERACITCYGKMNADSNSCTTSDGKGDVSAAAARSHAKMNSAEPFRNGCATQAVKG